MTDLKSYRFGSYPLGKVKTKEHSSKSRISIRMRNCSKTENKDCKQKGICK